MAPAIAPGIMLKRFWKELAIVLPVTEGESNSFQ